MKPKTLADVGYVSNHRTFIRHLPPENIPQFVSETGYQGEVDFISRFFEIYNSKSHISLRDSIIRDTSLRDSIIRDTPASSTQDDATYWYSLTQRVERLACKANPIESVILLKGFDQIIGIKDFVFKLIEEGKVG